MESIISYLLSPLFFEGAVSTLKLTLLAQVAGVLLGFFLALAKISHLRFFRMLAGSYIWIFRGIPVLVQLIFVYNALPQLGLKLSEFQSAIVALTLNEGAYMSEIIRSGLTSVSPGQQRAGYILGMTRFQIMRYITIPQALKVIVPPTANQFIGMLKTSSLASVVGYGDLLLTAQQMASASFDYMHTLVAVVIYYLVFTAVFTAIQIHVERRMDTNHRANSEKEGTRRLRAWMQKCFL